MRKGQSRGRDRDESGSRWGVDRNNGKNSTEENLRGQLWYKRKYKGEMEKCWKVEMDRCWKVRSASDCRT